MNLKQLNVLAKPEIVIDITTHKDKIILQGIITRDRDFITAKMITKAEFSDNPLRVLENFQEEAERVRERLWNSLA